MSCKLRAVALSTAPAILFGAAMLGAAMLGGCTAVDPGFGEALKYDMAVQTVDPDPVYPQGSAEPGDSGVVGAAATKRYRTDAVKAVETQGTTSSSSGSGSGSGPR